MTNNLTTADAAGRERQLDTEVRALRQQLAQREEALCLLNRRLLQLETGDVGLDGMDRAAGHPRDGAQLQSHVATLEAELERLHNTKLFRWASPARSLYAALKAQR